MKLNTSKILAVAGIVLGVLAVIMLAAAGLSPKSDYKKLMESVSLAKITFGKKGVYAFSFMNFLSVLLVFVGIALCVISFMSKSSGKAQIAAAVCFLIAGILFFCAKKFICYDCGDLTGTLRDTAKELMEKSTKELYKLGAGAIMAGIFSIAAAVVSIVPVVCGKLKKQ